MLKKLVFLDPKEVRRTPCWVANMGTLDELPTPSEEVEENIFWHDASLAIPEYIEFRQVKAEEVPGSKFLRSCQIYWYYDQAYAIFSPVNWRVKPGGGIDYVDKPRYFRIGCNHQDKVTFQSNCYKELKCELCGRKISIDSSG